MFTMALDISSEDTQASGPAVAANSPFCTICNSAIQNPPVLSETFCSHSFHKICINSDIKTHSDCPVCGARIIKEVKQTRSAVTHKPSMSVTTRSSSKDKHFDANARSEEGLIQEPASKPVIGTSKLTTNVTIDRVAEIVTYIVSRPTSSTCLIPC